MIPLIAALGALGAGGLLSRRSDMTGKDPGMIGGVLQDLYRSSSFATAGNYRRAQQFQAQQQQQQQQDQQAQQKRQLLAQAGFPTEAPWAQNITPEEVQSQLVQYQRALGGNQATAQYNLEAPQRALDQYGQELDLRGKEMGLLDTQQQMQARQQDMEQQALQMEIQRQAIAEAAAKSGQPIQEVKGDYLQTTMPDGTVSRQVIQGSATWNKTVGEMDMLQTGINAIGEMSGLYNTHGRELWGEVSADYEELHGRAVDAMTQLRDMGVISPGELESLTRRLMNPADMGWPNSQAVSRSFEMVQQTLLMKLQDKAAMLDFRDAS